MIYPYGVIVENKKRTVTRMDGDKYLLAGGDVLEITPFEPRTFKAVKLKRISKLTYTDGRWVIDGGDLQTRFIDAIEKGRDKSVQARTQKTTDDQLRKVLDRLSAADREKISGVAFFDEKRDAVEGETEADCAVRQEFFDSTFGVGKFTVGPPLKSAKCFWPVLLLDFSTESCERLGDQRVGVSQSAPEYFVGYKAAARHAGKTERTIKNWKRDGWLKVEQVGKKIRIAKSELDRCINKQ